MRMLAAGLTVDDAIRRGVCVDEPDGREVGIMDRDHRFAIFEIRDGVARTLLRGPFSPPPVKSGTRTCNRAHERA